MVTMVELRVRTMGLLLEIAASIEFLPIPCPDVISTMLAAARQDEQSVAASLPGGTLPLQV